MIFELKKRLKFDIVSIQFVKRDGFKFLDIELPDSDLKTIEEKSKVISDIIDEIDQSDEQYYLNIYSSGTEKDIDIKNINLFLEQYLLVRTFRSYLEKNEWEGLLIENGLDFIVLKVNNKGRIQKLKIEKKYISYIKTTAKVRKE